MSQKSPLVLAIGLGLMILSSSSTSRAAFETVTQSMSVPQSTTDYTKTLALPTFNSSLGTLTNIVISYSDSSNMSGYIQNTSSSAQSFKVSEDSSVKLSYGTTALLTNDLIAQQSFTHLGAGQTATFGTSTPNGQSASYKITSGPLFNAFLQPSSSVMLTFNTLTSTSVVGGGGNISTGILTTVGITLTVQYQYVPLGVPEPASLVMTSMGGLGFFAASRFRKRRASR